MKSNKDKIYDFIKLHGNGAPDGGISTAYIADALELQRTNVSSILNQLTKEKRIQKSNGRPVLYRIEDEGGGKADCFFGLLGHDGSLKQAVQLAKAAVLYPGKSLDTMIVGERGTGKSRLAKRMYQFALDQGVLPENAPYIEQDCRDYVSNEHLEEDLEEIWKKADNGMIFLGNVQFLSSRAKKALLAYIQSARRNYTVIISCTDRSQIGDEFLTEFPVQIELPTLAERPLEERLMMIQHLFSKEAARVKRTLVVRGDLVRALLLYECEANYYQLKGDIKIGCANAYVREYKNQDEIQLFLSDFANCVRKGLLQYRLRQKEVDELVKFEQVFSFDGTTVNIREEAKDSLYDKLNKKARELNETGFGEDEINMLLSAEVDRSFNTYKADLVSSVVDKAQLEVLVDSRLIGIVEDFLTDAGQRLKRTFPSSVFYGLCLHINAVIHGNRDSAPLDQKQVTDILAYHKQEYLLSMELADALSKEYHIEFPVEDVIFITMFLYPKAEAVARVEKPVILFAFYGEGIATAIVKTITCMTQWENVYAFELAYGKATQETYDTLKSYIADIHQGEGVLVIYDSSFLSDMLMDIEEELGIVIRQIAFPVATIGIEIARKALTEHNIDHVYRYAVKNAGLIGRYNKNYIVTLCTTGRGGAEELKRYIERYGQLNDTEVVALGMADKEELDAAFKKLMRNGLITCVVGTFDPGLFAIPFISISEVFGTKKENLPKLLSLEREAKKQIDYDSMFEYLGEQLEHTSMEKLKKVLPELLKEINAQITELSLDTEAGLLIHIACCVERLIEKEPTAANPRKKVIFSKYEREFKQLLKIFKPLEKTFHIIINDDEIANILTIIYQL